VSPFQNAAPTPAGDWRHIVRFGLNAVSYKFALGQALLELAAQQQTFVPLPELAVPYAARLCEHLQVEDRQSTAPQSRFLDLQDQIEARMAKNAARVYHRLPFPHKPLLVLPDLGRIVASAAPPALYRAREVLKPDQSR
jgi:hypothetical protein